MYKLLFLCHADVFGHGAQVRPTLVSLSQIALLGLSHWDTYLLCVEWDVKPYTLTHFVEYLAKLPVSRPYFVLTVFDLIVLKAATFEMWYCG